MSQEFQLFSLIIWNTRVTTLNLYLTQSVGMARVVAAMTLGKGVVHQDGVAKRLEDH